MKGLELMQRHKIWSYLYKITDIQGREDLVRAILTSLDYNVIYIYIYKYINIKYLNINIK